MCATCCTALLDLILDWLRKWNLSQFSHMIFKSNRHIRTKIIIWTYPGNSLVDGTSLVPQILFVKFNRTSLPIALLCGLFARLSSMATSLLRPTLKSQPKASNPYTRKTQSVRVQRFRINNPRTGLRVSSGCLHIELLSPTFSSYFMFKNIEMFTGHVFLLEEWRSRMTQMDAILSMALIWGRTAWLHKL